MILWEEDRFLVLGRFWYDKSLDKFRKWSWTRNNRLLILPAQLELNVTFRKRKEKDGIFLEIWIKKKWRLLFYSSYIYILDLLLLSLNLFFTKKDRKRNFRHGRRWNCPLYRYDGTRTMSVGGTYRLLTEAIPLKEPSSALDRKESL